MFRKITAFLVVFCLVFEQSGFAQVAPQINIPAYLAGYLSPDRFRPVHLRSISFDQTTHNFNLLVDKGDVKKLQPSQLEETTRQLFQYFQIGLNLPNSMFWVNLRPDDPAHIIDPYLEKTDLGRVLLEADLQLKKDMAARTSPDTKEGKAYWNRLYAKAEELFGQSDLEIPTVTRPWIVPGEIIMAQSQDSAYVYKATLRVMLEQDYLKDAPQFNPNDARFKELNEYSSRIIREEILPKLTRQVNSARRYAGLRQAYYSLILAQWYKQKTPKPAVATIDSRNLDGLTSKQQWSKQAYYQAYKKSFEQGEYNKEETVPGPGGLTIRRYFSGGIKIYVPKIDGFVLYVQAVNRPKNIGVTIDPVTHSTRIVNPESLDGDSPQSDRDAAPEIMHEYSAAKDGGSYITDFLSVLPAAKIVEYVAEEIKDYTAAGRKALVVDASDNSRNENAEIFRKLGFTVSVVTSPAEAFHAWEATTFDVISVNGGVQDIWLAERIKERNSHTELFYFVDGKDAPAADRLNRARRAGIVNSIIVRGNEKTEIPLAVRDMAIRQARKDGGVTTEFETKADKRALALERFIKTEFEHYVDGVHLLKKDADRNEVITEILHDPYYLLEFYDQVSLKLALDHNVIRTTRLGLARWQMLNVFDDIFIVDFNINVPGEISVSVEKTGAALRDGGTDKLYSGRFVSSIAADLKGLRGDREISRSITERITRFMSVHRQVQEDLDDPRRAMTEDIRNALRSNMPVLSDFVKDMDQDTVLRQNVTRLMMLVQDDHRVFDTLLSVVTNDKDHDEMVYGIVPLFGEMKMDYDQMSNLAQVIKMMDGGSFSRYMLDQKYIEDHDIMPIATGVPGMGALHGYVFVVEPDADLAAYVQHIRQFKRGTFTVQEQIDLRKRGIDPDKYSQERGSSIPVIVYIQQANPLYDPLMALADGVIQAQGNVNSHGYMFCNEMEIPVVTDVREIMLENRPLRTGDLVTLDATNGRVYALTGDLGQAIPLLDNSDGFQQAKIEHMNRILSQLTAGRVMVLSVSGSHLPEWAATVLLERFEKVNNKPVSIVEVDQVHTEIVVKAGEHMFLLDWTQRGVYTLADPETGERFVSGVAKDGGMGTQDRVRARISHIMERTQQLLYEEPEDEAARIRILAAAALVEMGTDALPMLKEYDAREMSPEQRGIISDAIKFLEESLPDNISERSEQATVGGIDMRALPVSQPAGTAMLSVAVPGIDSLQMTTQELDEQWQGIEKSIKSGPVPYDKLKAHAIACCGNKDAVDQRGKFIAYIAGLLKLEEAAAVETASELKEVLAILG
ncbi:MAG TPA: PEP-utilizing enzyme [Candidatus Omnitrophota bacterium]|nr:PEP-utilizing enzyme [Candidatus Omnitrophota bacterium]